MAQTTSPQASIIRPSLEKAGRSISNSANEAVSARAVYSDPIKLRDSVIVPAAYVLGFGGVRASGKARKNSENTGFGVTGLPAGSWIMEADGYVRWRSTLDRTILLCGLLLLSLVGMRIVLKAWTRRQAQESPQQHANPKK